MNLSFEFEKSSKKFAGGAGGLANGAIVTAALARTTGELTGAGCANGGFNGGLACTFGPPAQPCPLMIRLPYFAMTSDSVTTGNVVSAEASSQGLPGLSLSFTVWDNRMSRWDWPIVPGKGHNRSSASTVTVMLEVTPMTSMARTGGVSRSNQLQGVGGGPKKFGGFSSVGVSRPEFVLK